MRQKERITILLMLIIIPFIGFSQSISKKSKVNVTENNKTKIWKPINKFPDKNNIMQTHPEDVGTPVLTNVKEGVSFYKKTCESSVYEIVILLKVVNSNSYPVKISWQLSPKSPKVSVDVPANSEDEGTCSAQEGTAYKLVLRMPLDGNVKKVKKYVISHLSVTK